MLRALQELQLALVVGIFAAMTVAAGVSSA